MASKIGTPGSKASDSWFLALPVCRELTVLEIAVDCMLIKGGMGGQGLFCIANTGGKCQEPLMVSQLVSPQDCVLSNLSVGQCA